MRVYVCYCVSTHARVLTHIVINIEPDVSVLYRTGSRVRRKKITTINDSTERGEKLKKTHIGRDRVGPVHVQQLGPS